MGVGELSAINAIAGAYAEYVPVVHIVGTVPMYVQAAGLSMHHSLGNGEFKVFAEMYSKITCAQANLTDAVTATTMIDSTLRACITNRLPVYIELPTNMVTVEVSAAELDSPLDLAMNGHVTMNGHREGPDTIVDILLEKIYAAKQPFIVVDGCTTAYKIKAEANALVHATGFLTATSPFGKGIINESYPNFYGIYSATAGDKAFMSWVQDCDLVLWLGPLLSDANTHGFTTIADPEKTISIRGDSIDFGGSLKSKISDIKGFMGKVLSNLDRARLPEYTSSPNLDHPAAAMKALPPSKPNDAIDQVTFWLRTSSFFRPGDIILTESGTPSAGSRDFVLPPDTTLINSAIWLSIGYMLSACQGAALAQREMIAQGLCSKGRTILFEGDGSLQMTTQAISDIIRNRLDVIIFVINNDGYAIERLVHGMTASYNDIQPWNYLAAPHYFGAPTNDPNYPVTTRRAENWGEMNAVLEDPEVQRGKGLCMVEVVMGREDAPLYLWKLVEETTKRNATRK